MAKKMKRREMTDRQLREYYDAHSMLSEKGPIKIVKMTFPKPRELVALRLEGETIAGVKRIAARKGLNYSTLMRMWITERLRREGD
jgi:predicted DNA binding CopG/RHH family protein